MSRKQRKRKQNKMKRNKLKKIEQESRGHIRIPVESITDSITMNADSVIKFICGRVDNDKLITLENKGDKNETN